MLLKWEYIMDLTIKHLLMIVKKATSKRERLGETFKPRPQGTGRDNESAMALKRRDLRN
jgi:hypothetical protein